MTTGLGSAEYRLAHFTSLNACVYFFAFFPFFSYNFLHSGFIQVQVMENLESREI